MVDSEDFRLTIRRGSRAGNAAVVVHCRTDEHSEERLVGFVVPKRAIPLATQRNRVKRQLRHLMNKRINTMLPGMRLVIRAQSASANQKSAVIEAALDDALKRAYRKCSET